MFFVFIFDFVKHKSVRIFDVHIMLFSIINYKQQIHRVFKFFIWNVNWKNQLILMTKHLNGNVVFFFDPAKVFLSHRKSSSIIIKIINKFFLSCFVILSRCVFTGLIYLTWQMKNIFYCHFGCWLVLFLGSLILQAILHKNFLIMVCKLKY